MSHKLSTIGHNLIPHFIQAQHQARRSRGRFEAASMFVDISGFTALTETLMQYRKDGAEVLTDVLNRIFVPIVHQVYGHGGFITTFAGDAFTALFPAHRNAARAALRATQAAFDIQRFFAQQGATHTRYGDFGLNARIGLGLGQVQWGILGRAGHYAYFFCGLAVDRCAEAEHQAAPGQVMASLDLMPLVQGQVESEPAGALARLGGHAITLPTRQPRLPALERGLVSLFVQDAVLDRAAQAEFREVANLFISLEDTGRLDEFTLHVLEQTLVYGGYFNKIDFGDKGPVILVVFGAPLAHENDLARAADLILSLEGADLGVRWRAGLTCGTVYAGLVGGVERCEYTVIGDVVNLSSRLVQQAGWGECWMTSGEAVQLAQQGYQAETIGLVSLRGKSKPNAALRLVGKDIQASAEHQGELVGRGAELAGLAHMVQPIFEGRFAGVVYVHGEAGVGKSRLVYELQARLAHRDVSPQAAWLLGQTDQILHQPLSPFRYLLRVYFGQSPLLSEAENKRRFNQKLDALLAACEAGTALARELERARSFLGVLVGLHEAGSLYEQLEPKLRFENTLYAVKTLVQIECVRRPVILHIEDAHGLDEDSLALLQVLTRNMAGYPLAIVMTCRYREDGSRFAASLDGDVPQHDLDLNQLSSQGVQALASQVLGGGCLAAGLIDFLLEKTSGNPFFVEQLVLSLRERGVLQRSGNGTWRLEPGLRLEIPSNISAVLVARLDRLAAEVKAVVQTAAVLGREFEVVVLSHMLRDDQALPAKVKRAQEQAVWMALSEIRYIFRHALLRDAAYEMQLGSRLRELHAVALEALERVYAGDLSSQYDALAYHAAGSHNLDKQREYYARAGLAAQAAYQNAAALDYYERLLPLLASPDAQVDFRLKESAVLETVGQWETAGACCREALALAEQAGDAAAAACCRHTIGVLLRQQGNLKEAIEWLEQSRAEWAALGDRAGTLQALLEIGSVFYWQGEYATARRYYEAGLALARELGDKPGIARALNDVGIAAVKQGDEAVVGLYEESLALCRELDDKRGMARALNNLGIIADNRGDHAAAQAYFEEALALNRDMGNRRGISTSLYNLGIVIRNRGDYAAAQRLYEEGLALCQEMGDKWDKAYFLGDLGRLAAEQGNYVTARALYQEGIALAQEVGDKGRIASDLAWLAAAFVQDTAEADAATQSQNARRAARLAAAVDARLASVGGVLESPDRRIYERVVETARAVLGQDVFAQAWAEGQAMTFEQAIRQALGEMDRQQPQGGT